ncbi:hypothetical protein BDV95DRAFT_8450 [Massariosphaeria phaeospora]|uniref:Uncharacterized protein n=1 Tax=Massariosphaeria phaeospora TaxID=100035 RepID=A0A7C8IF12_9PLEO|nr:hypothetical protein BDV95DRAFT_8450 [Massariosphaeria phaeospora]
MNERIIVVMSLSKCRNSLRINFEALQSRYRTGPYCGEVLVTPTTKSGPTPAVPVLLVLEFHRAELVRYPSCLRFIPPLNLWRGVNRNRNLHDTAAVCSLRRDVNVGGCAGGVFWIRCCFEASHRVPVEVDKGASLNPLVCDTFTFWLVRRALFSSESQL